MTDYKLYLGYLALAIEIISYTFYFTGIYRGKTKPHAFTWFVWGTLNIIGFAAVIVSGGRSGAWVFAGNAICNYIIAGIGFAQRRVEYDLLDWLALSGGLVGALLWWLTRQPLAAVILLCLSDSIGIIPSLRKAYKFPWEENVSAFVSGIMYYVPALFALEKFTVTTSLYHFAIIAADLVLVILVLVRRRQLKI